MEKPIRAFTIPAWHVMSLVQHRCTYQRGQNATVGPEIRSRKKLAVDHEILSMSGLPTLESSVQRVGIA